MSKARLISSAPVLLVANVELAANYYRDKLGFNYSRFWGDPPGFCILNRDDLHVMLSLTKVGNVVPNHQKVPGMWNIYFWVDDAKMIYEEIKNLGAIIDYELFQTDYGCLEFGVKDLDGYDIAFGQDLN